MNRRSRIAPFLVNLIIGADEPFSDLGTGRIPVDAFVPTAVGQCSSLAPQECVRLFRIQNFLKAPVDGDPLVRVELIAIGLEDAVDLVVYETDEVRPATLCLRRMPDLIGIGLDPRYLVPEPVRAIIQETECYAEEPKENIFG